MKAKSTKTTKKRPAKRQKTKTTNAAEELGQLIEKEIAERKQRAQAILRRAIEEIDQLGFHLVPKVSTDAEGFTEGAIIIKPNQQRPR